MVVFIHSLGSLWQEKTLPAGGTRIWNTTGIRDGPRVRSCAKIFGQVRLGAKARTELGGSRELTGAAWTTSELIQVNHARKLALLCRAARALVADLYLVTVTDRLIGELRIGGWDATQTTLVSFSKWRSRQEVMLLVRPFAWLSGSDGSAVLAVNNGRCEWTVTRW